MSKKLHINTPDTLAYPLFVIKVPVSPNDNVSKGDILIHLQTADKQIVKIAAPIDAKVGSFVIPKETYISTPGPFIEIVKQSSPSPSPRKGTEETQTNEKFSLKPAIKNLFYPVILVFFIATGFEIFAPDMKADDIWIRWIAIIGGFLLGTYYAATHHFNKYTKATATFFTTCAAGIAFALCIPLEDYGIYPEDISISSLFKEKVHGIKIDNLHKLSNGITPTRTQETLDAYKAYLND